MTRLDVYARNLHVEVILRDDALPELFKLVKREREIPALAKKPEEPNNEKESV